MNGIVHVDNYLSSARINAGKINLGDKLNQGRGVGVVVTAMDVHTVYAVFMYALGTVQSKGKIGDTTFQRT